MPRDLGDVLHYFFDESEAPREPAPPHRRREPPPREVELPLLAVPLGDQDVVRAAMVWNLAVEIARGGWNASVVAPAGAETETLWPEPGRGPLGAELVLTFAEDLGALTRSARDVSATTAGSDPGVILVRVPPDWLSKASDAPALFSWTLLLTSPDPDDLLETYAVAKRLHEANPRGRIGVTIHGPRCVSEAREAFDRLDTAAQRHLGRGLVSYGLLIDDVHVYRSIVSRRPVGLTNPRAGATKALQAVADLLVGDAKEGSGA
ncbi:MAG: hypothetical protein ABFS46_10620 [Myxococcota bacterium]